MVTTGDPSFWETPNFCDQPTSLWTLYPVKRFHEKSPCNPMKKHHVDFQNPPFWRNSHLVNILGLISIFIYEIPINHPLLYHHFSVFFLGEKSPHFWWKIPSLGFPEQGFAVRGICHTSLASCLAGDEQVPGGNMCPCFVGYPMGYDYIYLYIYIYTIYLFI